MNWTILNPLLVMLVETVVLAIRLTVRRFPNVTVRSLQTSDCLCLWALPHSWAVWPGIWNPGAASSPTGNLSGSSWLLYTRTQLGSQRPEVCQDAPCSACQSSPLTETCRPCNYPAGGLAVAPNLSNDLVRRWGTRAKMKTRVGGFIPHT